MLTIAIRYTDVFRPVDNKTTVPGVIAWGPYGKEVGGQHLDDVPGRSGVPKAAVSGLQKFEAPDPAYWVCHGYAILNPDSRGSYWSEGNQTSYGRQMAEDGYDYVEWAAKQPWSNGKLAFSGNSYLAISQWFIAAEAPPHLAAIAPWEGFMDGYREASRRGGSAIPGFGEEISQTYAGRNYLQDQVRSQLDEGGKGLMTPYWDDQRARVEKIKIPAYVVASYTSPIHAHGSFEGFRRISTPTEHKWLRAHNSGEWPDYYDPAHVEDLRKFFDHYLKGIDNGWEKTPRVRYAVLDPGGKDTVDRIDVDWPPSSVQNKKLYLGADKRLSETAAPSAANISYTIDSKAAGQVELVYKVPTETELVGYSKVRLHVEAVGSDDMEITVAVTKRDAQNKPIMSLSPFTIAAAGLLRVSHRALDMDRSTDQEPYLLHTREELLEPGKVYAVDIALWPIALRFRAGEHLVLSIAATSIGGVSTRGMFGTAKIKVPTEGETYMPGSEVKTLTLGGTEGVPEWVKAQVVKPPVSRNKGSHIVHVGGKYDSFVVMPWKV
jgi:predicted acyl esterase